MTDRLAQLEACHAFAIGQANHWLGLAEMFRHEAEGVVMKTDKDRQFLERCLK